jgi:hypothetical protein
MRGGVAAVLGFLGGVFILLGVFVGVLASGVFSLATFHASSFLSAAYEGVIDLVLGILVMAFTAYAVAHPPPDKAIGGVVVLLVSIIAWYISSNAFLLFVIIGAILAAIAGFVFILESAFQPRPYYPPSSH